MVGVLKNNFKVICWKRIILSVNSFDWLSRFYKIPKLYCSAIGHFLKRINNLSLHDHLIKCSTFDDNLVGKKVVSFFLLTYFVNSGRMKVSVRKQTVLKAGYDKNRHLPTIGGGCGLNLKFDGTHTTQTIPDEQT